MGLLALHEAPPLIGLPPCTFFSGSHRLLNHNQFSQVLGTLGFGQVFLAPSQQLVSKALNPGS